MCPQLPRLSPEYSHKAGLQTVITGMPLQMRPVAHSGHVGPVTMGRIARGPPNWTRPRGGRTSSQAFVWCRIERRVSLPVLSSLDQRLWRRLRAEGGGFAFAPTGGHMKTGTRSSSSSFLHQRVSSSNQSDLHLCRESREDRVPLIGASVPPSRPGRVAGLWSLPGAW
jgi:hypothetical protein